MLEDWAGRITLPGYSFPLFRFIPVRKSNSPAGNQGERLLSNR